MVNYAKINNQNVVLVYPYQFINLIEENPYSSYDERYSLSEWFHQTDESVVHGNRLVEVGVDAQPSFDPALQVIELASTPALQSGQWLLLWSLREKTEAEKTPSEPTQPV